MKHFDFLLLAFNILRLASRTRKKEKDKKKKTKKDEVVVRLYPRILLHAVRGSDWLKKKKKKKKKEE